MICHYRAYIGVAIKLPSLDYNNLHKISSAKSDGLGIGWGVRDPRLGRNSTMKEVKSKWMSPLILQLDKGNQRGRNGEKKVEKEEGHRVASSTTRLYASIKSQNHFWDPMFHQIIYLQEKRRKLENR
uniref:Uncharacterized protein n=1 Tax=Solanum demissum TaxID=50514 RepID=Q6L3P7_SOLDE|nr:hypothetical protein SDM1_42t00002 [Solanum demissum]